MRYLIIILAITLLTSCRPDTYTPKPRGYYRIAMPERAYQAFDDPAFPYRFEYPVYGRIVRDTNMGGMKPDNPWWINVDFPDLGGRIYLSYKTIDQDHSLANLLDDAHEMSYFHTKKADYINAPSFNNGHNVSGVFYNVGGNAASTYQFFATDTARHFLRGALYFDVTPNVDSLKPVNEFLKKDMEHLLETLRWK